MDSYSLLITHQLVSFKRLYVAGIYSPSFLYDRIVGDVYILKAGETIIMPAKKPHAVYGKERFKMLLNVVFLNAYSRLKIKLQYQDLKSVFIESISVNTDFFWR